MTTTTAAEVVSACPMQKKGQDMPNPNQPTSNPDQKPLKPCCACPDTRKARDECILVRGEEEACREYIEAHKSCLRSYGFEV